MSTRTVVRAIRRTAARQEGRITTPQLVDAKATRHQVRHWVATGWLVREHRGVYTVGAIPRTRRGTFQGALLATGDESALSFEAAGAHWDVLGRRAVRTEVTVPLCGRPRRKGIVVHRALLLPGDVVVHDGLRVTSLVRTHLDLAGVLPPKTLARMFEQAQVRHHLDPTLLAAEVLCWSGRRGMPALREVLEGAVDPAAVKSVLELRFLELCAAHGIERPLVNEQHGPWELDFWWPQAMHVVETDGWNFHRTAAQRRRDAEKDAWLRSQGFTVVRLTWHDVTADPLACVAAVARGLAATPAAA